MNSERPDIHARRNGVTRAMAEVSGGLCFSPVRCFLVIAAEAVIPTVALIIGAGRAGGWSPGVRRLCGQNGQAA